MIKLLKNKTGQFYIFIAIILISIAFSVATMKQGSVKKTKPLFKQLTQNYEEMAPKAVNNAVYEEGDVKSRFSNFTQDYMKYARTRDPKIGIAYILVVNDELNVYNGLGEPINVMYNGTKREIEDKGKKTISKDSEKNNIRITMQGINYDYSINDEVIQIKALFKSEKGKDVQIKTMV